MPFSKFVMFKVLILFQLALTSRAERRYNF